MDLIHTNLHSIQSNWNTHIISRSRYGGITGRPNSLYYLPHLQGKDNFSSQADPEEIEEFDPVVFESRDISEDFVKTNPLNSI